MEVIGAHLDWRWIFFLNVPIGLATVLLAVRYVPVMRVGFLFQLGMIAIAFTHAMHLTLLASATALTTATALCALLTLRPSADAAVR